MRRSNRHGSWLAAFALLAVTSSACGPRRSDTGDAAVDLALAIATTPDQDVVLWTARGDGRLESWWIRGSSLDSRALAAVDGLVLPLDGRVWVWRAEKVPIVLCDCAAWEEAGLEGGCPPSAELAHGTFARLEDLVSGEVLEFLPAPVTETEEGPVFADFGFGIEPVGAVGPYLFVRGYEQSLGCGAAHHSWASTFEVFDLAAGEPVEILGADELAAIDRGEREAAFAAMRGDPLVSVKKAEDLELTAIEPTWVTGAGLSLRYQFTAGASFAASDDSWGSYSRSISVPARGIPAALLPFAALPAALENSVLPGGEPRVAGVAVAEGTPEQLATLAALFGPAR
jgi:hypothetical protein